MMTLEVGIIIALIITSILYITTAYWLPPEDDEFLGRGQHARHIPRSEATEGERGRGS